MIRRPPRSTRMTHSFPPRRSSDLLCICAEVVSYRAHWQCLLAEQIDVVGDIAGGPAEITAQLRHQKRHIQDMDLVGQDRSEEHTSELQSLMRISYAVFCLKKKKTPNNISTNKTKQYTQAIS